VMGYAGRGTPLKQIAGELGVGSVMEGSVQVVGGRLRVNVQLIDAASDAHLWAEHYDRTLDDAFAIQSDVAQKIVAAVGAALGDAERKSVAQAPSANAEAYRLYLQGREYRTRPGRGRRDLESAQQLFERAVALDSGFALAHAELSQVHGAMYWWRYDPSSARAARQLTEAETALRLAPNLPQAHLAMGLVHYWGRLAYGPAMEEFGIAIKALPSNAELLEMMAMIHRRRGEWKDADSAYVRAIQLDPRDANLFYNLGAMTYLNSNRYAEAVRAFDQALSLAPDLHVAAVRKGIAYVRWQGQLDTLRAALRRVPGDAELPTIGSVTGQRVQLLLWTRQPDSILAVLRTARVAAIDAQIVLVPASLFAAWAHRLRGDGAAARAAFDSARAFLDSAVRAHPADWRAHASRGLTLAGMGRRDEARADARWLKESLVYREDAMWGPPVAEDRARILAQIGDADASMDEIERLLNTPSWLTVHTLRLDPLWDPIRDLPRFKGLLTKYAKP
jgi:tetratricopeptide (TPR) repeat protein